MNKKIEYYRDFKNINGKPDDRVLYTGTLLGFSTENDGKEEYPVGIVMASDGQLELIYVPWIRILDIKEDTNVKQR